MKFLFSSRKFTNICRFIMDELLPPLLRDSSFFNNIFLLLYKGSSPIFYFKKKILELNSEQFNDCYRKMSNDFYRETDLNQKCIDKIVGSVEGKSILDVGAGNCYLAKKLLKLNLDVFVTQLGDAYSPIGFGLKSIQATCDNLPFDDNYFDTVICTHVLEHVIDFESSVKELRRICKKKLIIVVPMQRPYLVTPDLHIHFFPKPEFFIIRMRPRNDFIYEILDGDIYFEETY